MAAPPKPWKAEYAKSGRSSCKTCKAPINKETLKLGKMVQSSQFDGFISSEASFTRETYHTLSLFQSDVESRKLHAEQELMMSRV